MFAQVKDLDVLPDADFPLTEGKMYNRPMLFSYIKYSTFYVQYFYSLFNFFKKRLMEVVLKLVRKLPTELFPTTQLVTCHPPQGSFWSHFNI